MLSLKAILLLLSVTVFLLEARIDLHPCGQMDTLSTVARNKCIANCKIQGCDDGYCKKRGANPDCVCSRCENSPWSFKWN